MKTKSYPNQPRREHRVEGSVSCNNGFWDLPPEDRASAMDRACERGGVSNFFDLPPEDRAQAYDES